MTNRGLCSTYFQDIPRRHPWWRGDARSRRYLFQNMLKSNLKIGRAMCSNSRTIRPFKEPPFRKWHNILSNRKTCLPAEEGHINSVEHSYIWHRLFNFFLWLVTEIIYTHNILLIPDSPMPHTTLATPLDGRAGRGWGTSGWGLGWGIWGSGIRRIFCRYLFPKQCLH